MKYILKIAVLILFTQQVYAQSVLNPGFENGNASWSPYGEASVVPSNAHTGSQSLQIAGYGGAEQTIRGLSSNTTYILRVWVKTDVASQSIAIGVKNFGSTQVGASSQSTSYTNISVRFTTGGTNTSAVIWAYKNTGSADGYVDDYQISLAPSTISHAQSVPILNPGFDNGSAHWSLYGGSRISTASSNLVLRSLQIVGYGGAEQTIRGLSPNTTYILSARVKTSDVLQSIVDVSESVYIGVKDYGSAQVVTNSRSNRYTNISVRFTTGSTNTSAIIWAYRSGGYGLSYVDDYSISIVSSLLSAGNTNYYINATIGNDNNNGTSPSTSWRTLARVNDVIFAPGDRILFKSGEVWNGMLYPKGNGSSSNRITVSKYGGSTRPKINGGNAPTLVYGGASGIQTVHLSNQQYWTISDLEITNDSNSNPTVPYASNGTTKRRGIYIVGQDVGTLDGIVIRNCYIHNVHGTNDKDGTGSGGIFVVVFGEGVVTLFNDVLIEKNRIENVIRTGIATDTNWQGRGIVSDWNPNPYHPFTNIVIKNNILKNIGGDGIQPGASRGTIVEHNYVERSNFRGASSISANVAIWAWNCDTLTARFNEVAYTQTTSDGTAFDIDANSDGHKIEYNYSHHNVGGFLLSFPHNSRSYSSNHIVRYNISEEDEYRLIWVYKTGGGGGYGLNNRIYNNTFYTTKRIQGIFAGNITNASSDVNDYHVDNNIFYLTNTSLGNWNIADALSSFRNNIVYTPNGSISGTQPGSENLSSDPKFYTPGGGTPTSGTFDSNGNVTRPNVDAYKLTTRSPALNAGITISNNGAKDYWGNAVSSSVAPHIGAYNGVAISSRSSPKFSIKKEEKEVSPLVLKLYPNPTNSKFSFSYHSNVNQKGVFSLIDINGREVLRQEMNLNKGNNILDFDINQLSKGLYLLKGKIGIERFNKKIVIK